MKRKEDGPVIPLRTGWVILAVIVAVGAFFRLYLLGMSAFRADTILLWSLAQRQIPPLQVFTHWFDVSGAAGQMPMPAWIMQQFLALTGWNVTPFMVRFPFALVGILAVPVAFFAGRRLGGVGVGLTLSALLAVNSFHIATSREAYFYSTLLLGYFLYLWAVWIISDELWRKQWLSNGGIAVLAAALFFTGYSQITGLILVASVALLFFSLLLIRCRKRECFKRNLWMLVGVHAIVLLPVALASWGLRPILSQIGASGDVAKKAVELTEGNIFSATVDALLHFGWGKLAYGWVLLALSLIGGAVVFARERDIRGLWILLVVVVQIALFAVVRSAASALYEARYLTGILPFYLAFAAVGLTRLPHVLPGISGDARRTRILASLLVVAGVGLCVYPAYLQTQLTGKPTPYWELVRWTDSNLPPGTPVLVDRWFEPWNELAAHPSTNVQFTFTVPNEPVDVFVRNRWRDSARAFLEKYPDAVYAEIAKTYWEAPGVGPWDWPRQYFARHVSIRNEAGLKLRRLGLANRGDFYTPTTNRVIVEVFYNTPEDVISKARARGDRLILLYADGWDYAKPWQQTRDFRDWRVVRREAAVEIWNLTEQPMRAALRMRAVAVPGSKKIRISEQDRTFAAGQLSVHEVRGLELAPGSNRLVLRDVMPATESSLLVSDLEVVPEGGP